MARAAESEAAREAAQVEDPQTPQAGPTRLGRHDQIILACLRERQTHPTAAEVYAAVRRRHPQIGQATVYRALARLVAVGLVAEVGRDALGRHYDARTDRHD